MQWRDYTTLPSRRLHTHKSTTLVDVSSLAPHKPIGGQFLTLLLANRGPNAPQQKEPLFDDFVGGGRENHRHVDA
jgi:hypothetical protein